METEKLWNGAMETAEINLELSMYYMEDRWNGVVMQNKTKTPGAC